MGLSVVKAWRPWLYTGDNGNTIGGYITSYAKNFQFATVRGAGHMCPSVRGAASLRMMENMVFGKGVFDE